MSNINLKKTTWDSTSLETRIADGSIKCVSASISTTPAPIDRRGKFPYPLIFEKDTNAQRFIAEAVDLGGCAQYAQFEQDFARKVGRQGLSFEAPYLFEHVLTSYLDHHYSGNVIGKASLEARAAELRRMIFGESDEYLSVWSDVESLQRTAKNTSAAGFAGHKNDPAVMTAVLAQMAEPLDKMTVCIMGQRYQRNKKTQAGLPLPRGIFNLHAAFVAILGKYCYPLIDALQAVAAKSDTLTPFVALVGPYETGRKAFNWVTAPNPRTGKRSETWRSLNIDQRGMDQHFGRAAMQTFVDLTQGLFPAETRGRYREVMMACYNVRIVLDAQHEIIADLDALLSGLTCTNVAESVVGWAVIETIARGATIRITGSTGVVKEYAIDHFGPHCVVVNGDDMSLLVKMPPDARLVAGVNKANGAEVPIFDRFVAFFASHGFETALDKCSMLTNMWHFGMKTYSMDARGFDATGNPDRFLPVYVMTAAINSCINPEMPALGTPVEEMQRIAMIMDQTVGHPMFRRTVTAMAHAFKVRHGDKATSMFTDIMAAVDSIKIDPKHRAYSFKDEQWVSSESAFLLTFPIELGLSSEEMALATTIGRAVRALRAAAWQMRVCLDDGHLTAESISLLERALTCDVDYAPESDCCKLFLPDDGAALRVSSEYCHQWTFSENSKFDQPLTQARKMSGANNSSAQVTASVITDVGGDI